MSSDFKRYERFDSDLRINRMQQLQVHDLFYLLKLIQRSPQLELNEH